MVDMVKTPRNHDPDILGINAPHDRYIPPNLEFPSIQKTSIPVDFEAQIREIDTVLEGTVTKASQSMEVFSNSSLHSTVIVSKSNGPVVTSLSGPTQYVPLFEVEKATLAFVLGPGEVISKTLSSGKKNVYRTTKKNCKSAKCEGVKKDS